MYPLFNKVATEPPIVADPEGGELAISEQPVDCRPVDPQKVRQLIGGKQFIGYLFACLRFQGEFTFELEGYYSSGPTSDPFLAEG